MFDILFCYKYHQDINLKKIKFYKKSNHLQSTAGFIACFITFDSINHTRHYIFKTVCSGTAFLFCRVPLPSIRITIFSQGRSQNQTKFITCKRIQNNKNYSSKVKLKKNIKTFKSFYLCLNVNTKKSVMSEHGNWYLIINLKATASKIHWGRCKRSFRHVSNEIHGWLHLNQ